MKSVRFVLSFAACGQWALCAVGQGTFQNLDFESANLSPPPGQFGSLVPIMNALPGWTGFLGTNQTTVVYQNNVTLGDASIDILGPGWNNFSGISIIEGQYTVVLQPGAGLSGNVGASISQSGLVPVGTESIQFKARAGNSFSVSLGGQNLSLNILGTAPNYTLYGANIPLADAGQVEALTISVAAGPNSADYFDSFVFSPSAVPEPAAWSILVCGAGVFAIRRWRREPVAGALN